MGENAGLSLFRQQVLMAWCVGCGNCELLVHLTKDVLHLVDRSAAVSAVVWHTESETQAGQRGNTSQQMMQISHWGMC